MWSILTKRVWYVGNMTCACIRTALQTFWAFQVLLLYFFAVISGICQAEATGTILCLCHCTRCVQSASHHHQYGNKSVCMSYCSWKHKRTTSNIDGVPENFDRIYPYAFRKLHQHLLGFEQSRSHSTKRLWSNPSWRSNKSLTNSFQLFAYVLLNACLSPFDTKIWDKSSPFFTLFICMRETLDPFDADRGYLSWLIHTSTPSCSPRLFSFLYRVPNWFGWIRPRVDNVISLFIGDRRICIHSHLSKGGWKKSECVPFRI